MNGSDGKNYNNDSLPQAQYLRRPRIDGILGQAAGRKLVYVIAGAGYGKTQAVRQFIEQQQGAVVRWLQLTDNDNIGARYWENLTHYISFDNLALAGKLRELGFPETSARFKQFSEILKSSEHRANKTFLVLDDFHVINSKQALAFAERCAYLHIAGACVIIISRKEPDINAVPLIAKEQVGIVTEEELCFTESEISDFLKLRGVQFSAKVLPRLTSATKGWALAILLLSMALKRAPLSLDIALDTMKQNVYKLMEIEAFNDFPESIQKIIVKLSLAPNLPLKILQNRFTDAALLQEAPQLASFVWFDSFTGEERVHPLYWEFLQTKRHILTAAEEHDTYTRAAQWFSENSFYIEAMNYYAKSKQYDRMLENLLAYPLKLPYDACVYYLDILDDLSPDISDRDKHSVLLLKKQFVPLLLIGAGKFEEARRRILDVIQEWEGSDAEFSNNLLYLAYSNLAYIEIYDCTITHEYNFHKYMVKSIELYKKITVPPARLSGPFAVADLRSFACLVGEGADFSKFDQFLDAIRQTAVCVAETYHKMYFGYEDLVACELAFYKNKPSLAKHYAFSAILKARDKKQYSIEMMATQYLLRVSAQEGNYSMSKEILRQLRSNLENQDFWNRQLLYDLFTGYFYAQIGLPAMAPSWFVMDEDEKEAASEVHISVQELIVAVKCCIAYKKYDHAFTILCNAYPRPPHEKFALGELTLTLLTASVRLNTGDPDGAAADLDKAYALSYNGEFEMPFIELGKNLRPLVHAALNHKGGGIPGAWLRDVERKAAIYAKKTDIVMKMIKKEQNIDDTIPLSEREHDVLMDLYHGLSRDEIAANQYLSVNTVKKTLQSIYIKLDAGNNVDAVRIAIDKKLIR